jgi:hypothetical protein
MSIPGGAQGGEEGGDWTAAMRAGDFARAWHITDRDLPELCLAAPDKHAGPRHLQRIWRGEPLAGRRVLVRCYHGLGDTMQFARFLPALSDIAAEVIVWCQPELLPLIETVASGRMVPLHDGTPDVAFDVDIEIMEIPHAIRADADLVGMRQPYLRLPTTSTASSAIAKDRLAVGLVWEVGNWDKRRAVPPDQLAMLNIGGVALYSLQLGGGAAAAQIGALDISTSDLIALAQRICELDLVITVDTMVAHLAGALGRPCWVMLHADCDWRWPLTGERSIWYPSLRLFHQPEPGDWSSVVIEVRAALMAARG